MEAFYVSIIFLGVILIGVSLFFIVMDKVNGKDFFKEFDRKKEEMFSLIQDSEEMIDELNRMSDYVVSIVSEKNQEFFSRNTNISLHETAINIEQNPIVAEEALEEQAQEVLILPSVQKDNANETPVEAKTQVMEPEPELEPEPEPIRVVNTQFSNKNDINNKDVSDIGKSRLVLNSRRREVLQLIEQGLSNDEISDKLKIGKGEIGLIRGLSR